MNGHEHANRITPFERSPATGQADDGKGSSPAAVSRLASISRELSYNDPDADNGEDGHGDRRAGPSDRNTELLVRDPYSVRTVALR